MQGDLKNVFSLQSFRKPQTPVRLEKVDALAQDSHIVQKAEPAEELFSQQMRLNDEARKRRAEERNKANRSVLKSYKIKT